MSGYLLASGALALYRAAGSLAAPLIRYHMRQRQGRGREDPQRMEERFGRAGRARPAGRLVWLHASSVGEAISTLSLIEALRARWPDLQFLLTTGTVSSARLMDKRLPAGVIHQFAPIDQTAAVKRFFEHWRPDLGLIVESELWPNLLTTARRRGIELVLVNGRMSAGSFRSWRRFRPLIRRLLQCFSLVLAQSPEDRERFGRLGAAETRCPGNLKFAAAPLADETGMRRDLEAALGTRPRWLAASTHPGEEERIATAHRTAAAGVPGLMTFIVPRHPERGADIARSLAMSGLKVKRRGAGALPDADTEIYVADTLGELGVWYRLVDIAFMGGTLVTKGGQNPLEPAKLDCAILYGPHAANFQRIADEMRAAGALCPVPDAEGLGRAVARLLQDDRERGRLARNAKDFANRQVQVLERIVDALAPSLERLQDRAWDQSSARDSRK
jgi:3-deoxy-D-manno-octulosonic-acid transferase